MATNHTRLPSGQPARPGNPVSPKGRRLPPTITPLAAIEEIVQDRAKSAGLDVSTEAGDSRLRAFVDEEIRSWRIAHQRGLRDEDINDPDILAERAHRNLTGYGPLAHLLG